MNKLVLFYEIYLSLHQTETRTYMNKLPVTMMSDLNNGLFNHHSFDDIFLIAEFDGSQERRLLYEPECYEPVRRDVLLIIIVSEGTSEIMIDYVPFILKKNDLITIMPSHICKIDKISADFKAQIIVATHDFLDECGSKQNNRNQSISNYMEVRKNPRTILNDSEYSIMNQHLSILRDKIKNKDHSLYKEVVLNSFMAFLLDMADILMKKNENFVKPTRSRKEELMEKFLQLLVEHCRYKHSVSFYAENLFITPQYLSLILKELTGKSANKWIDEALFLEAKQLLKAPNSTVQQVAEMLCFSDQSTFGKFFKKHAAISPSEYRKS